MLIKKISIALLLMTTALTMQALSIGAQAAYRTDVGYPGLGMNYRLNLGTHIRLQATTNYYFKNSDGVHRLDVGLDAHWTFSAGKHLDIYPVVGYVLRDWFSKERYTIGTEEYTEKNIDWDSGPTVGAGIDYNCNYHWLINAEVKRQLISGAQEMTFSVGAFYRF